MHRTKPHARSLTKRRVIVSVFVPCRRADAAGAVSCFVLVLLHTAFLFTHATVSDIIRIYASDVGLMQPVQRWMMQHADAERADAAGMNCLLMLMSMHGLMQPVRSVEMTRTAMTSFSCFIVMVVLLLVTFFPPSLTHHPTHPAWYTGLSFMLGHSQNCACVIVSAAGLHLAAQRRVGWIRPPARHGRRGLMQPVSHAIYQQPASLDANRVCERRYHNALELDPPCGVCCSRSTVAASRL